MMAMWTRPARPMRWPLARGNWARRSSAVAGPPTSGNCRPGEWKVSTEQGDIVCEHVVNAGGTYARQMGEWSGLQLPMTSMTHHYLVTDDRAGVHGLEKELPVIRDDKLVSGYIRMEQKSGLIGIYEKENPNTVWEDHCPWEAENELFEADYDRIMPWLENAMGRMPIFAELGIKREVHGAISHPPDGNPLIGPAPGVKNYWCAAARRSASAGARASPANWRAGWCMAPPTFPCATTTRAALASMPRKTGR
jgi:glycine/D-amino acid oxidase-like deaminating enzyme